jgi:2,4-dienoyl-CoA reductase-like NADH-dependent reductase (Old Yellow Enzyme family)
MVHMVILPDNFLWEETNRRTDRWGGDRRCRSQFAVEVVKRIRATIGPDKPIVFRFSQWKQQDSRAKLANNPQELEEVLGPIADAGVDVFDASVRYFNRAASETVVGMGLSLALACDFRVASDTARYRFLHDRLFAHRYVRRLWRQLFHDQAAGPVEDDGTVHVE